MIRAATAPLLVLVLANLAACREGEKDDKAALPDPALIADALLSVDDLPPKWAAVDEAFGLEWTVGGIGNPSVCGRMARPRERVAEAVARFEYAPFSEENGTGGHGPQLFHVVATLTEADAEGYVEELRSVADSCPGEWVEERGVNQPSYHWTFSVLSADALGDDVVAFKRVLDGKVQGGDVNVVIARRGAVISIVSHVGGRGPFGGGVEMEETIGFARLADEKLSALLRLGFDPKPR